MPLFNWPAPSLHTHELGFRSDSTHLQRNTGSPQHPASAQTFHSLILDLGQFNKTKDHDKIPSKIFTRTLATMARGGRGGRNPKDLPRDQQVSRKVSWLLRHGATQEGLKLGKGGYVNVQDAASIPIIFSSVLLLGGTLQVSSFLTVENCKT